MLTIDETGEAYMVGSGNRVRGKECDNFSRSEASGVFETGEDLVNTVKRFRHGQIRGRVRGILATEKELEARSARAVRHTDSARELDEVGRRDRGVLRNEGLLLANDLVSAEVRL